MYWLQRNTKCKQLRYIVHSKQYMIEKPERKWNTKSYVYLRFTYYSIVNIWFIPLGYQQSESHFEWKSPSHSIQCDSIGLDNNRAMSADTIKGISVTLFDSMPSMDNDQCRWICEHMENEIQQRASQLKA